MLTRSRVCSQVSALDQELIEVDPDTKEMLKLLVSPNLVASHRFLYRKWRRRTVIAFAIDSAGTANCCQLFPCLLEHRFLSDPGAGTHHFLSFLPRRRLTVCVCVCV